MFDHATKMDTSEKKIRPFFQFFSIKTKRQTGRLKMYIEAMGLVLYQFITRNFGFVDFVSIIFMSKMHPTLESQFELSIDNMMEIIEYKKLD